MLPPHVSASRLAPSGKSGVSVGALRGKEAFRGAPGAYRGRVWGLGVHQGPHTALDRPTQQHTFLSDAYAFRETEQGLLQLIEDFQAGNLRAFGEMTVFFFFIKDGKKSYI